MAIVRAVKSGNWSDTTVWNTGSLPTSADDVYSNTFTVTIDVSPTVLSISNASATGVTAGGSFVPANGITLTCTGAGVVAGNTSASCFSSALALNQSCAVIANCNGGTGTNANGLNHTGAGTVNITGNCTAGAGSGNLACGVQNSGLGTINITGNCTGGSGSGLGLIGARNASTGVINITGNCIGGTGSTNLSECYGASNISAGTINHVGTVQASAVHPGIGGLALAQTVIVTGPFVTSNNGVAPICAYRWFWANSNVTPTYYQIRTANLATIRPLYTADSVGGNPAVSNVRSGTVYGPAGELTGTCAVPPAGSVALGVPVDNTTGTAYITANDIATALSSASAVTLKQQTSTLTTPGSIGERLKLASTVATTAQQLSDALSNE